VICRLFDNRTTSLVRLKMRAIVDELGRLIERSLQRSQLSNRSGSPSGDVDDEIDRLFQ
jgi:hypothetical protein